MLKTLADKHRSSRIEDGPQAQGSHRHTARAAQVLRSQDRTRRQEATGRTVRRHSAAAAEGRGPHRPSSRPGHHPPQGTGHPAPGGPVRDLRARGPGGRPPGPQARRPRQAGTAAARVGGADEHADGARPSWSARPATTPSTGSHRRSSRRSHRRAGCGESRMRRSGWGSPEKDPLLRAPRRRPTSALWQCAARRCLS